MAEKLSNHERCEAMMKAVVVAARDVDADTTMDDEGCPVVGYDGLCALKRLARALAALEETE